MNVIMIGNGFDLHYKLPTSYTSFLHIVEYLCKNLDKTHFTSVAQVLEEETLHKKDTAIRECYKTYQNAYNSSLDPVELEKAFGGALENSWFSYFLHSFDKEKGWIDFEKEIRSVIRTISNVIETQCSKGKEVFLRVAKTDRRTRIICESFRKIFPGPVIDTAFNGEEALYFQIGKDFLTQEPYGTGWFHVDKAEIASEMYKSLRQLVDMLATYLYLFVENPVQFLVDSKQITLDKSFTHMEWSDTQIVSFNYTHTIQLLYDQASKSKFHYIHGEIKEVDLPKCSKIILGVDPDKSDDLESMDISFVKFKKYYQRVYYQTDLKYLGFLENNDSAIPSDIRYSLYIIGHSLAATDQEAIKECFKHALNIIVFYHSDNSLSDLISNLVSVFGKDEFDKLRKQRKLQFLHTSELSNEEVFKPERLSKPDTKLVSC